MLKNAKKMEMVGIFFIKDDLLRRELNETNVYGSFFAVCFGSLDFTMVQRQGTATETTECRHKPVAKPKMQYQVQ